MRLGDRESIGVYSGDDGFEGRGTLGTAETAIGGPLDTALTGELDAIGEAALAGGALPAMTRTAPGALNEGGL